MLMKTNAKEMPKNAPVVVHLLVWQRMEKLLVGQFIFTGVAGSFA